MNITLIVDQRLTYREALKIAYDKAKLDGELDELTEASCQAEFKKPPPAAIYHESDMVSSGGTSDTGGVYFKMWTFREAYEQAKINARVCVTESLSDKISDVVFEIKKTLQESRAELTEQDLKFSINEAGEFRPVLLPGKSNQVQENFFTNLLNENENLRTLALEYVRMVASVIDFTLEGRSAFYARYFAPEKADCH
ncbi:hypothetical protein [Pseudomonas cichorii]|nr:hypothetical protein [Pseudomonas cichorii]